MYQRLIKNNYSEELNRMAEDGYKVVATVKEIQGGGHCPLGYREGHSWTFYGPAVPKDFCSWALQAVFPFISVLRFGGVLPWEENQNSALACCPDPNNPVVFLLKRIHESRKD